jgi:hypothetical protein
MDEKAQDVEVLTRRVEELQRGTRSHPNIKYCHSFMASSIFSVISLSDCLFALPIIVLPLS